MTVVKELNKKKIFLIIKIIVPFLFKIITYKKKKHIVLTVRNIT